MIASGDFGEGNVQDVGHEVLEEGFEEVGFIHGGVAVKAQDAALDVEKREDHGRLGEGDCIFDGWLAGAAIFDCVAGGEGEEEGEEDMENFHRR